MKTRLDPDELRTLDEAWAICREIWQRDKDRSADVAAVMIERVTATHGEEG